jgi:hypothetical protein
MSRLEINSENAALMEKNAGEVSVEDTMYTEALALHQQGLTPHFEIARLSQKVL